MTVQKLEISLKQSTMAFVAELGVLRQHCYLLDVQEKVRNTGMEQAEVPADGWTP